MIGLLGFLVAAQQSNFSRVFPNPTGTNGYEEFVRAGDLLAQSEQFRAFENVINTPMTHSSAAEDSYLRVREREAAEFAGVRALVAAGNLKGSRDPRREFTPDTLFPELASFKSIAKLEAHTAYVEFAHGRKDQGIQVLSDLFEFSRNISQGIAISRLVGIACQAIAFRELSLHFDQLSLDELQSIDRLAMSEIEHPPQMIGCLNNEYRLNREALKTIFTSGPLKNEGDVEAWSEETMLKFNSLTNDQKEDLSDHITNRIRETYSICSDVLAGPETNWMAYYRRLSSPSDDSSLGGAITSLLGPSEIVGSLVLAESRTRVKFHLMHLHCKLLEYRWMNGSLPASLTACVGADGAQDLICGSSFIYHRQEHGYSLSSIGTSELGPISLEPQTSAGNSETVKAP